MIYLLARTEAVNYDEYDSKVVRAPNEQQARELANEDTGDEGTLWNDPEQVTCESLDPNGEAGVILGSFHAG